VPVGLEDPRPRQDGCVRRLGVRYLEARRAVCGPAADRGQAKGDRNAVSQFYSFGVGGKGIVASRPDDRFGVGWYYSRFSDDLKNNLRVLRRGLRNEQGVEAFYNIQVTPAVTVTPNLQVIVDPAARGPNPASEDYALVFGVRLQMDF